MNFVDLEKITGAIISNYIALHFNEEIKHTKYYKQSVKNKLNGLIRELQKLEEEQFEMMYGNNEDNTHAISSNIISFIDIMVEKSFTDMVMLQTLVSAYTLEPENVEEFASNIINKHKKNE